MAKSMKLKAKDVTAEPLIEEEVRESSNKSVSEILDDIETAESMGLGQHEVDDDGLIHGELLAGVMHGDQRLKTFAFREMTGADEEALGKAQYKDNSAKAMNAMLARCTVSIGDIEKKEIGSEQFGQIIRKMYGGDLDYMFMRLRAVSRGDTISFKHNCPSCGTQLNTLVDIDEWEIEPFAGKDVVRFELPRGYKDKKGVIHKAGQMRMINGEDREIVAPLMKKNAAKGTSLLIQRVVTFNDGYPITEDVAKNMVSGDREFLEKLMDKYADFGYNTYTEMECENCGANLSGELGANFMK